MIFRLRQTAVCILAGLAFTGTTQADEAADAKEHPLTPAIRYATECMAKVDSLPGYEATFFKREVVGSTLVSQKLRIKIRHEPFSVYLYFETPNEGREVIYVDGSNSGNLLVHEAGLAGLIGTLELAPGSPTAMNENRYPVTMAGISKAVQAVIDQWEEETKYAECEVKYFKDAKLGTMKCRVVESSHPEPRKQFKFHKTRLWVDEATGYPVRIQQFAFPKKAGAEPPVVEDYTFTDIKTDVKLTDVDFDTKNPKYNF
ncbi:MAG: DUF1571 domain-containing protein [Planctomycetaceae bacterium]